MKGKGVAEVFGKMEDPRVVRCKRHDLMDIITITIAAVLCGAEGWNEIELYGKTKEPWLRTFLRLPGGIPSHDTFNRCFAFMDPLRFEECFTEWVRSLAGGGTGQVCIDGKTLRGTGRGDSSPLHMVSAWASDWGLVLGQVRTAGHSNEITAIPELLKALLTEGMVITIDAMGCQREIAKQIIGGGAHYVLAVKDNQPTLLEEIEASFRMMAPQEAVSDLDFGHGRIETRSCSVITDLTFVEKRHQWAALTSLVRVTAHRHDKRTGKQSTAVRYYISSLSTDAAHFLHLARSHWEIENKLHWVLDVTFREDASAKRAGNAAQNFSVINKIALNIIRHEKTVKASVKARRMKAGWDNDYLKELLKL